MNYDDDTIKNNIDSTNSNSIHAMLKSRESVLSLDDVNLNGININNCSIEVKWDGNKLKYDMITRWGKYELRCEMEVIHSA